MPPEGKTPLTAGRNDGDPALDRSRRVAHDAARRIKGAPKPGGGA